MVYNHDNYLLDYHSKSNHSSVQSSIYLLIMALTSLEIANAQNSLVVLKNVLTQTCSPSPEVRQEIRSETGLSDETIKSWFIRQNGESLSISQQERLKSHLRKNPFVTKESIMRIAEDTSLKPKTVFRWFIRKGCPFIRDDHVQLLQSSFGHFPFLTKTTMIQLSKRTSLLPKTIIKWFMEEYKIFDKELASLIKLNRESKRSHVMAQGGVSEVAAENGQKSTPNSSQWYPEHPMINREETWQTRPTRHNSFKMQKLQDLQNLLVKNGSFKRLGKWVGRE